MSEENTQPSTPLTEQEQQSPSLGVQDLLLMFQVLQVVAQRGGFKADEMTNIGGLHDRLKAFLLASGVIKPPEQKPPETQE